MVGASRRIVFAACSSCSSSGGCMGGVKEASQMKRSLRAAFDPKAFPAKVAKGRTLGELQEEPKAFLARRSCRRHLLHSDRQGQTHGCLQTGQGSGGRLCWCQ